MKKNIFYSLIVIFIFALVLTGCGNVEKDNNNNSNDNDTIKQEQKETEIKYADDEIVNKFITEFKNNSQYEIRDIKKGNIRTKYFLYINNRYVELLNATSNPAKTFNITIYGGNQNEDIDKIINVYKEVIKTLDNTISDEKITQSINEYIKTTTTNKEFNLKDNINVSYFPIVELSTYTTDCRIEIETTIYNND